MTCPSSWQVSPFWASSEIDDTFTSDVGPHYEGFYSDLRPQKKKKKKKKKDPIYCECERWGAA